jgi:uncharacterized protein (TIGR02246 family)
MNYIDALSARARRAVAGIALAAVALPCLVIAATANEDPDVAAVRAVGEAWKAHYRAGEYAAIPELYTEDTMVMPRGRPRVVGREQLRKAQGGLAAGRRVDIEITEREIQAVGDFAWYVGDFRVTYTPKEPGAAPQTEFGRSLVIFRKGADGRWRIHRDIDSPAPPPP